MLRERDPNKVKTLLFDLRTCSVRTKCLGLSKLDCRRHDGPWSTGMTRLCDIVTGIR
jgi:hypothetical protein